MPDAILVDSFVDYVSSYESGILREAIDISQTDQPLQLQGQLADLFGRLGCQQLPTPQNVQQPIVGVARREFLVRPLGALYALREGVPKDHHGFWGQSRPSTTFTCSMLHLLLFLGESGSQKSLIAHSRGCSAILRAS